MSFSFCTEALDDNDLEALLLRLDNIGIFETFFA